MDSEQGQGGSALPIQISQAGWTEVVYLPIHVQFYKRPRFWRQERLFTVYEGRLVPCDLRGVPPGCCRAAAAA